MQQIGEGSFSRVYRAVDEKGGNIPYAVKILKESQADEETVHRFQQEVQLTQQLEHPNIVRIYSCGFTEGGALYLVTEFFEHGDLLREIDASEERPLPFLRAVNLTRFICQGLAHAHARKVLHRDIKPENILVTPSRGIKLTDFGIGLSLRYARRTARGAQIGTPSYMAPEQIAAGELGPWTDVYAIGIVAFQLLTGKLPFESETDIQVLDSQRFSPVPSLLFKGGGIPCWMEDIVFRACEKDPARRFQDAGEMLVEIQKRFAADRLRRSLPARIFYFLRPNGQMCTFFTERGVPRKRLGYYLFGTVFALTLGVLFWLSFK